MESRSRIFGEKVVLVLSSILLSLILPLSSSGYLKGDVDSDDKITLTEAITALQITSGARSLLSSKTINVPGDIPTIQQAIDAAAEGDIISIAAGTYNEVLVVEKNYITLQGAGKESTIVDGGGLDVIVIDRSSGVSIKAITVRNGKEGILGKGGSVFYVRDVIVQDCSDIGIWVYGNASGEIVDTTVLRSGFMGISISRNASAMFSGSISTSNNTAHGLHINMSSSCGFDNAVVTTKDNGARGIWVGASSSLISRGSGVTVQANTNHGVVITGTSCLRVESGTWVIENNTQYGLAVGGASKFYLNSTGSLTSRQNKSQGIVVIENSNAELSGTVLVEDNVDVGLNVTVSSSVSIYSPVSLTIRGTQGGMGIGIVVQDVSSFKAVGGTILVENNTGSYGDGVFVVRNSAFNLVGTPVSWKIRNNGRYGVSFNQSSRGQFIPGLEITGNASDGLVVSDNSGFCAGAIKVQSNNGWGVVADEGGNANIDGATINGNGVGDVKLGFGSRATLTGNTIGVVPITCDGTALSRGTHTCP